MEYDGQGSLTCTDGAAIAGDRLANNVFATHELPLMLMLLWIGGAGLALGLAKTYDGWLLRRGFSPIDAPVPDESDL